MRAVDASAVLKQVAGLMGFLYEELPSNEFKILRTFMDERLREGWKHEVWPELTRIEQRWFRDDWSSATSYSKAGEVFHRPSQRYFQSLRDTNLNHEPAVYTSGTWVENSAYWAESKGSYSGAEWVDGAAYAVGALVGYRGTVYQCHTAHTASSVLTPDGVGVNERWGALTAFVKRVDYEQTGQLAIESFVRMTTDNPRVTTRLSEAGFTLAHDGAICHRNAGVSVWVQFRIRRPVISGDVWSSGSTYAVGQQVYFTTSSGAGNWYDCLATTSAGESPATTAAKWDLVEIPEFMEGFLVHGVYARWLAHDGQHEKGLAWEGMARSELGGASDWLFRQQRQLQRVSFER